MLAKVISPGALVVTPNGSCVEGFFPTGWCYNRGYVPKYGRCSIGILNTELG